MRSDVPVAKDDRIGLGGNGNHNHPCNGANWTPTPREVVELAE